MCIFLGGLPGAGKSKLKEETEKKFIERQFVVIDADEYRKFYPNLFELKEYPKEAIFKTSKVANAIEQELLDYAIQRKKNIILVSTLRAKDAIKAIIKEKLRPQGYKVGTNIIAVPIYDSALSAQIRYEEQILDKSEVPRFTSIEFVKDTNQKILSSIRELDVNDRNFDFVNIFKRGKSKDDLPIMVYQNDEKDNRYRNALEAYIEIINLESKKERGQQNIYELKRIYDLQKKRESTNEEITNLSALYDYFTSNQEQYRSE